MCFYYFTSKVKDKKSTEGIGPVQCNHCGCLRDPAEYKYSKRFWLCCIPIPFTSKQLGCDSCQKSFLGKRCTECKSMGFSLTCSRCGGEMERLRY